MINLLGYQSTDNFIESQDFTLTKSFIVTRSEVINKTIGQLNFLGAFNSRVTRVYRTGLELLANDELVLHYGDKLRVVGAETDLVQIEKFVGNSEKRLQEPQLLSIFLGIILFSSPIFSFMDPLEQEKLRQFLPLLTRFLGLFILYLTCKA